MGCVRVTLLLLLLTELIILPSGAFAQRAAPENKENTTGATNVGGLPADVPTRETFQPSPASSQTLGPSASDYIRIFVGLAVVLLIVWGFSVILKRFVTIRGLASSTESLKLLYTQSLSPTRALYLVRLGDRILLIGGGEGGLRTLAEITEPSEVSAILKELEFKGNFEMNPFKERLRKLVGGDVIVDYDEEMEESRRKIKRSMERLRGSKGAGENG